MIRAVQLNDATAIAEIYNYYVANTVVTFEEAPVSTSDMADRIKSGLNSQLPWLAVIEENKLIGYAFATKWRARSAYQHSVEITVYLDPAAKSKGYGTQLYKALFERLKTQSIHTVIGGISLPNPTSIALHEKFGMQKAAHFKQVGRKFDRWVDTGYWQVQLAETVEE